MSFKPKEAT
uniref:Uncharacterized protein n=1 Tax=Rhizophora mucronata TaxID=61149 RepID=A0A2P2NPS6_RHIMU